MIHPEDKIELERALLAMKVASGAAQADTVKRYRILEDKAICRALTDLDTLLATSPVKSANRMLAFRHIEDASMRLGKDLQECAEPNPYPNSKDTSNVTVDATAPEVSPMPPYQLRVVIEKAELDAKTMRLKQFIGAKTFVSIPEDERGRLIKQHALMQEYSSVLESRITQFPKPV